MKYANRLTRIICGCLLLSFGIWGAGSSFSIAKAQLEYKHAKFGLFNGTRFEKPARTDPHEILKSCEKAHRLYQKNYYFSTLAAEKALTAALNMPLDSAGYESLDAMYSSAEYWDRVSMRLNPQNVEAQFVHCRILIENGDYGDAIRFWKEKVVEPAFWNPDRHEYLVHLYLNAGEKEKAVEESKWVRNSETLNLIKKVKSGLR